MTVLALDPGPDSAARERAGARRGRGWRWGIGLLGLGFAVVRMLASTEQANEDAMGEVDSLRVTAPVDAALAARRALATDPLDGRAYRILAELKPNAASQPDPALLALALAYAPRDAETRLYAARAAMASGDDAAAARHLDRFLRVAPLASEAMYPTLRSQLASASGLHALAAVTGITPAPPWRAGFMAYEAQAATSTVELNQWFGAVQAIAPLSRTEVALWVQRLTDMGAYADASEAWQRYRPQAPGAPWVFDPDFAHLDPIALPFEWTATTGPGVETEGVAGEGGAPGALRVTFTGSRANFPVIAQVLQLPTETPLRLTWDDALDDLQTPRGLHWTLRCAEGASDDLLRMPGVKGSHDWQRRSVDVRVPSPCRAEWLRLELDARIPAESEAVGTVRVRNVRVDRAN